MGNCHGITNILQDDLCLVKKSSRLVPKLLDDDQKKELVKISRDCIAAISCRLGHSIVTMEKTMVSYHLLPVTRNQFR
jgi:hypothetical protein